MLPPPPPPPLLLLLFRTRLLLGRKFELRTLPTPAARPAQFGAATLGCALFGYLGALQLATTSTSHFCKPKKNPANRESAGLQALCEQSADFRLVANQIRLAPASATDAANFDLPTFGGGGGETLLSIASRPLFWLEAEKIKREKKKFLARGWLASLAAAAAASQAAGWLALIETIFFRPPIITCNPEAGRLSSRTTNRPAHRTTNRATSRGLAKRCSRLPAIKVAATGC